MKDTNNGGIFPGCRYQTTTSLVAAITEAEAARTRATMIPQTRLPFAQPGRRNSAGSRPMGAKHASKG